MSERQRAPRTSRSEAQALLSWYECRQRTLPWRGIDDPYRIWVSEVMLQQTQVKTVIPYYEAFLARFPTVEALAAASIGEVLALWSGLGYYRRARQLHRAAQEIVHRGEGFPTSARAWEKLPGIGPYTAAAIASIAFGEAVPVLDGNVERVLSRYVALSEDPKQRAHRSVLLALAAEMLDRERPGESNQALMELGATLCTPRRPRCGWCPIAAGCRGRESGNPERYPPPRRRRELEKVAWSVALAERRGRVLFFRRPPTSDLLPGMWELPNVPREKDLAAVERALAAAYGGSWRLERASFQVRHSITYRSLTLHVHRAAHDAGAGVGEGSEAAWLSPAERSGYGVSSMFEKILIRSGNLRPDRRS